MEQKLLQAFQSRSNLFQKKSRSKQKKKINNLQVLAVGSHH
jgi:hypothetical protein